MYTASKSVLIVLLVIFVPALVTLVATVTMGVGRRRGA
jgi:hypothetical protein